MFQLGKKGGTTKYFDFGLLFLIFFLIAFGLVMLYSVSTYAGLVSKSADAAHYLKLQLRNIAIGAGAMAMTTFIPYRKWKKLTPYFYLVALLLCIAVLFIGQNTNGSTRWIYIGPLSIQPSEVAKLTMILFLAATLSRIPRKIQKAKVVYLITIVYLAPTTVLIAITNMSSAIIFAGIWFMMMFVASPKYSHFIGLFGLGAGCGGGYLLIKSVRNEGYRAARILSFFTGTGETYQTMQGLYAIGSGGLLGRGLGNSLQKLGNVPEVYNDFIFSVICEELGILGAIGVLLLYVMLIWRMMLVAMNAPDLYGSLIVVGVIVHISLQVIFHVAVVTNTMPNTGVSLPFFSYGGSAMLFLMAEMGFVLNVAREIRIHRDNPTG